MNFKMRKADEMERYQTDKSAKIAFVFYTAALLAWGLYNFFQHREDGMGVYDSACRQCGVSVVTRGVRAEDAVRECRGSHDFLQGKREKTARRLGFAAVSSLRSCSREDSFSSVAKSTAYHV